MADQFTSLENDGQPAPKRQKTALSVASSDGGDFNYNSQSLFDIVNDLPDELNDYQDTGNTDDVQNAHGNKDTSHKHVQLSALLQNNPSQSSPVPSRSPNIMNNPLNSIRSPLSNNLSSPPHNNMVGKPASAGNDLNFVSSSAAFLSNTNTGNNSMPSSNVMGSHVSSIPSSMTGYNQRNPIIPNGPQYAASGQGRGASMGQQLSNLSQPGMIGNMNNPNLQARMNMVNPVLQQNVPNHQQQLVNQNGQVANSPFGFNAQNKVLGQPTSTVGFNSSSMAALITTSNMPTNNLVSQNPSQQTTLGGVGGQVGGGLPGTGDRQQTPTADPDKRKLIQQQLVLLLHAHKCQRRQQNNGETCGLPHCKTMKNVLNHMTTCNAGKSCQVAHCASSRQIITHWKNCTRSDCPVCLPLKNASDQKRPGSATAATNVPGNVLPAPAGTATAAPAAPSQPVTTTQSLPNVSDIQMQRAYAALGLPYTGSPSQQSGHQQGGLNIRPPSSNSPGLSTIATGNQTSTLPSLSSGTNNPLGNLASIESSATTSQAPNMAQTARGTKEWHQSVTQDLRNHLVHKLVQAIFPTPDPAALKDRRMTNLVAYARKVEGDMYDTANSREEYYHLLAEKIYKIQKELEEKRLQRLKTPTRSPGPNGPLLNTGGVPQPTQPFGGPRGPLGIDQPNTLAQQLGSTNPQQLLNKAQQIDIIKNRLPQPQQPFPQQTRPQLPPSPANCQTSVNQLTQRSPAPVSSILSQFSPQPQISQNTSVSSQLSSSHSLENLQAALQADKLNSTDISTSLNQNTSQPQTLVDVLTAPCTTGSTQFTSTAPATSTTTLTTSANSITTPAKSMEDVKPDIKQEVQMEIKTEDIKQEPMGSCSGKEIPQMSKVKIENDTTDGKSLLSPKTQDTSNDAETKPSPMESAQSSPGIPISTSSSTSSNAVAVPSKPRAKKIFKPDELRQSLMPVLEKLYKQDPESMPFRQPVDPVLLGIPDYFDIVKTPMDLSLIRRKLDTGQYADPWQFCDDIWMMMDNAWLYNRKTSRVYKFASKLAEVFEGEIDSVMQSLGYCCGRKHVFSPQVLCCYGKQLCTISRDAVYYSFQNRKRTNGLYSDRYIYCEKCFNEIQGDEVELADDPTQPVTRIKKNQFERMKNDQLDYEPFVECDECGRRLHMICVLHFEQIWPNGYTCDNCHKAKGSKRKENRFTARNLTMSGLPSTKLGTYLENRVNNFLRKKEAGAGEVFIKVISCTDKVVEVKPGMKARFVDNGEMQAEFPYRAKAMFAFEEIDGVDVCFFGMHVQEYDSHCQFPNNRRVYISYLDSVHFFQPRQLRTAVYHEILIGYLEYAKQMGFTWAHIWACPPSEGDDYIFHCHPPEQKIPKPKRLQEWYKKMLDKAIIERCVIDYKDILKDAIENNIRCATQIPYFEGDFWPNVLEESIKELDQEEEEKKKREEAEAAAAEQASVEEIVEGEAENPNGAGKKKGKGGRKLSKNKNKNSQRKTTKKPNMPVGGNDLTAKIFSTMEKHKEVFFVIRLHSQQVAATLQHIRDPDPYISCDLMDGRDAFLTMARDKHQEFSSLRRAKFSTLALLYELHNQQKDNFVYTCNTCKAHVETRWHCTVCEDFDLCTVCYEKESHCHKMDRLGLDLDDGSSPNDKQDDPQQSRRQSIQRCIQSLVHACQCRDANCRLPSCQKMKRVVSHTKCCRKKANGVCPICKQLIALCLYHAKHCTENKCQVPFCLQIKHKLRQQQLQHRLQQAQMLRRRMASMQRSAPTTSAQTTSQQSPTVTGIQQQPIPSNFNSGKPVSGPPAAALQAAMAAQEEASRQASLQAGAASVASMPPPPVQTPTPKVPTNSAMNKGGWPQNSTYPTMQQNPMNPPPIRPPMQPNPINTGMQIQPQAQPQVVGVRPGMPNAGPQRPQHMPALEQLLRTLKSPNSPQQQQQVLQILKSNPHLMAAFIKQRTQQQGQNQQHNINQANPNNIGQSPQQQQQQQQQQQLWQLQQQQRLRMQQQQQQQNQQHPGMQMNQQFPQQQQFQQQRPRMPYNPQYSDNNMQQFQPQIQTAQMMQQHQLRQHMAGGSNPQLSSPQNVASPNFMQSVRSPNSLPQTVRSPQPNQLSRQQLNPSPRQPQMSPHVNQSSHPNMMGTDPNQLHSDPNLLLGSLQGQGQDPGLLLPNDNEVQPLTPQDQLTRFVDTL